MIAFLKRYFVLLLILAAPAFADDYPDKVSNMDMDVDEPVIDLVDDAKKATRKVRYYGYFLPGYFMDGTFEYNHYRKEINGVLEERGDVDIIPVRIPKDKYHAINIVGNNNEEGEFLGDIRKMIVPKDPSQQYNPLFFDYLNVLERERMLDDWVDDPGIGVFNETQSQGVSFRTFSEALMQSVYDEEVYYIVVFGLGNANYPVDYTIVSDVDDNGLFEPPKVGKDASYWPSGDHRLNEPLPMDLTPNCDRDEAPEYPTDTNWYVKDGCIYNHVGSSIYLKDYVANPVKSNISDVQIKINALNNRVVDYTENAQEKSDEYYDYAKPKIMARYEKQFERGLNEQKTLNIVAPYDNTPLVTYKNDNYDPEDDNHLKIFLRAAFNSKDPNKQETMTVNVINERSGEEELVSVKEVECPLYDTGDVEQSGAPNVMNIKDAKQGYCFYGELEYKKSLSSISQNNLMGVSDGNQLTVSSEYKYKNDYLSKFDDTFSDEKTVSVYEIPQKAKFSFERDEKIKNIVDNGFSFNIEDKDKNKDPEKVERAEAVIQLLKNQQIVDEETVEIEENGKNSGIFEYDIDAESVPSGDDVNSENGIIEINEPDISDELQLDIIYKEDNYIPISNTSSFKVRLQETEGNIGMALPKLVGKDVENDKSRKVKLIFPETGVLNVDKENLYIGESFSVSVSDCGLLDEDKNFVIKNSSTNEEFDFELSDSGTQCEYKSKDIEIKNRSAQVETDEQYVKASIEDELIVEWVDSFNNQSEEEVVKKSFAIEGEKGVNAETDFRSVGFEMDWVSSISFSDTLLLTGGNQLTEYRVVDGDLNKKDDTVESHEVSLVNETTNEETSFEIVEKCKDCNQFTGQFKISEQSDNGENYIVAKSGDSVSVSYKDRQTESGNEENIEKTFKIKSANDLSLNFDSDVVLGRSTEISIDDNDKQYWGGLLQREEPRFKEIVIKNTEKGYQTNFRFRSGFSVTNEFEVRPYEHASGESASKGYEKTDNNLILYAEKGDQLVFEGVDPFGVDSNNFEYNIIKTVQNDYLEDSGAVFYLDDLDINTNPTATVYSEKANQDSSSKDTIEVEVDHGGFSSDEQETFEFVETEKNSSRFEYNLDFKAAQSPSPQDGVIQYPEEMQQKPRSDYYVNFKYEYTRNGTPKQTNARAPLLNDEHPIEFSITPENFAVNGNATIVVDDPSSNNYYNIYVNAIVKNEYGQEVESYYIGLTPNNEGVYKTNFTIKNPNDETVQCGFNSGPQPASVSEKPVGEQNEASGQDLPPRPSSQNTLCATKGQDVEFEYGFLSTVRKVTSVQEQQSAKMFVDDKILIKDEVDIQVDDPSANQNSDEKETVNVIIQSFIENSNEVMDNEEVELTETSSDSGIFEVTVDTKERAGDASNNNNFIETKITKFQNPSEKLRFGYVIDPRYKVLTKIRNVLGGFDGKINAVDETGINSTIDVEVVDLDENKTQGAGNDVINVNVINTRTEQNKTYIASETQEEGVFDFQLPIYEETNGKDSIISKPNDTLLIEYEDEQGYLLESSIVDKTVKVKSGNDGILTVDDEIFVIDEATIGVNDLDEVDSGDSSQMEVEVVNNRTEEKETVLLDVESVKDGFFEGDLKIEYSDVAIDEEGVMGAQKQDELTFSYLDEKNSSNEQKLLEKDRVVLSGNNGAISSDNEVLSLGSIEVVVDDEDLNTSPFEREQVTITSINQRTKQEVEVLTTEKNVSSSEFEGRLITSKEKGERQMAVEKGDIIEFVYEDQVSKTGQSRTVSAQTEVEAAQEGVNGVLRVDERILVEDEVSVSVEDADLNTDSSTQETSTVIVNNERTDEQVVLDVVEEGESSNLFNGTLETNQNNSPVEDEDVMGVLKDDVLTFIYFDATTSEQESATRTKERVVINDTNVAMDVEKPLTVSQEVWVKVDDPAKNTNAENEEQIEVVAENTETGQQVSMTLNETAADSGSFDVDLQTQYSEEALDSETVMGVEKDDVVEFRYDYGGESPVVVERVAVAGIDAELTINPEKENDGLKVRASATVKVDDADRNKDPESAETINVSVKNEATGQTIEAMTLVETDNDAGIFQGELPTVFSEQGIDSTSELGLKNKDNVQFVYIDTFTSKGEKDVPVEVTKQAFGGVNGELNAKSDGVVGDSVAIEVVDDDENSKATEMNEIDVNVSNPRTNENETVTLSETGVNTGIFEGEIKTVQSQEPVQNDSLAVVNDDTVEVVYEDQFTKQGGTNTLTESVDFSQGHDGEITVSSPNEIGQAMQVSVSDRDLDVSDAKDRVVVSVENERTGDEVSVELTETGGATHTFTGNVFGVNEAVRDDNDRVRGTSQQAKTLTTRTGDYLEAVYVDEMNANGNEEELSDKGLFLGEDAIVIDKQAQKESVVVGDFVPYQVSIENTSPNDLANLTIIDTLPSGFRMAKDKVYVDDETRDISASGGTLSVYLDEIESGEVIDMTYVLKPSSGVVEGVYKNEVEPFIGNIVVGNKAQASVRIDDDPLFSDALVFGKVFHDKNGNGYQDKGENGIAGVTIAGVDGMNVVTDSKGRFHIEAVDGGRMERGRNYILKVMPKSLPDGATMTTENPRVHRITQGMPAKFNFGVKLPERGAYHAKVEIHLAEVFFDWDKDKVKEQYKDELKEVASIIEQKGGGVIIIEGNTDSLGTDEYNQDLGLRRASAVYQILKEHLSDRVYQNLEVKINDGAHSSSN